MVVQNDDPETSEIGFGTPWEVILEGLALKGPKRWPKAVQRLFERKRFKRVERCIKSEQGTQKAPKGNPRAPRGSQRVSENSHLYIQMSNEPPLQPLCK